MDAAILADLLAASVRIATPLLLAALGGILSERSGTFAVAIEGMMLAGAFGAAIAAMAAGAPAGLLASAAAGMLVASLVAVATTRFSTDQMVTGLAVNILVAGLTSYLLRALAGGRTPVVRFPVLAPWPVPLLGDMPVLGPVLFRQPPLTYLAVLLAVGLSLVLARSRAGLLVRAAGENPQAVFATGTDPVRVRVWSILACGALAGLGGAALSLQQVGSFTDGMTHGRGFIALAALIVGRWTPLPVALACLVFGLVSALALRAQGWGLPVSSYVMQMMPYALALVALAGIGRAARLPAAIGTPFRRD
ncbi:ABC transporter permease [Methylobacterium terricola]|uniref:ABC transporter permease n=1 Tax=Methylobacterium terricola TaxID=2583531 RepID=A0A5C4L6I5_9HYPH|nr:ABC transporter permease [Methylobacterium terricola]TNC07296.1 ABC transporter permease [Methylobacterium terricola]